MVNCFLSKTVHDDNKDLPVILFQVIITLGEIGSQHLIMASFYDIEKDKPTNIGAWQWYALNAKKIPLRET